MITKLGTIFMALALTSSPTPADNYYSWVSPEIANVVLQYCVKDEYHEHLDFNGDGKLSIADAVGILRRYNDNVKYGNEITVDSEVIESIIYENWSDEPIYYEIDRIENDFCREYTMTVNDITEFHVYVEFEEYSSGFTAVANPFEEIVRVID